MFYHRIAAKQQGPAPLARDIASNSPPCSHQRHSLHLSKECGQLAGLQHSDTPLEEMWETLENSSMDMHAQILHVPSLV